MAVLVGAAGVFYFANDNRARISSVAVLPFANASGDPSMEYLSDGITEGVIDKLSGLPNIRVISRTSVFHYKQCEIEPEKAAKELAVQALDFSTAEKEFTRSLELNPRYATARQWFGLFARVPGARSSLLVFPPLRSGDRAV